MICTTAAILKTKILIFNLFLTQILRKLLCANLTICCWCLMIMCCLLGWHQRVFIFLTVNNYQLSKIKTETPTNKCSFQSKQITCSFICFPIIEQHCLSITSFVPLRIRRLSESIDWFCPNVWSFLCWCYCYTAYEHVVAQSMSPLTSLNWF